MTTGCHRIKHWLALLFLLGQLTSALAAPHPLASRYERWFEAARQTWSNQPTNVEAAWKYARACFDWSEFASNDTQRAEIARLGVEAARKALSLGPTMAAAHYYLGLNLGRLAEATRTLGGLRLVSEMERSFKKAAQIDSLFDNAGPDRCLGLLYRDAPGWPISVGSRSKARHHLERARELAGNHPENLLKLLQSYLKWGEKDRVAKELPKVEERVAEARTRLTGEEWALSWLDWDEDREEIRRALGLPNASPGGK